MSRGLKTLGRIGLLAGLTLAISVSCGCQRGTTLDGPDYEFDWHAFFGPIGAFVMAIARAPAGLYQSLEGGPLQGFDSAAGYEFWRLQHGY